MLITSEKLIGTPLLSVQAAGPIAVLGAPVIDPETLKIVAFRLGGPLVDRTATSILDARSIREFSSLGAVIDSADEFIEPDDVIKIEEILKLNFNIVGLKVETKKRTHLGQVASYTVTTDDFMVQQLIVRRPLLKSFLDPELTIPRSEVMEVTDTKIIVKDEEQKIRERARKEDFIPNFVNPFRSPVPAHALDRKETPDDKDTE